MNREDEGREKRSEECKREKLLEAVEWRAQAKAN